MNLKIKNGLHINAILVLFGFQSVHVMAVSWLKIKNLIVWGIYYMPETVPRILYIFMLLLIYFSQQLHVKTVAAFPLLTLKEIQGQRN